MNRKNILANIWRFSVIKSVVFMLIMPTVGSLIVLSYYYYDLSRMKNDVLFTNVAGGQRMLSEQLGAYAHMVHDLDQEEDREPLRKLVATFDQRLVVLDQGGEIMSRRLPSAPQETQDNINLVKQLWQDLKPALLLIADQPTSSPQAVKANDFIKDSIPRLRDLSDEVVYSFELLSNTKKEQIFRILILFFIINFVLLFTGVLVTKRYLAERKKATDALLELKAYAESIIRNFLDTLIVVDTEARIKTVNPETCSLLGYREEELIGEYIGKVFAAAEEEEEEVKALFLFFRQPDKSKLNPHTEVRNVALTYVTKDGRNIPMSFNASTLSDENGNVTAVVAGAKDISSIKQAQEALRESKVYMENILSSMTDALFVVTPDATIQTVNGASCALLDYAEDELTGLPIGQVFEEEEEEEEVFTKHVLSMTEQKLQVIYDHDSKDFWHLLQTAHMGVVLVGFDGKIVMVNKETTSIFGYNEGELIGEMIHMLLPAKLGKVHEKERREFMTNPSPRYMGEGRLLKAQHKDGTTFEVEVGLVPLQIDGITHVVGVIRDPASKERWEFIRLTRFGRLFAEEEEEEEVFWNVDRNLVSKNGGKIPVLMSGAVMRDDNKEIQGAVLVAKNITERKQAQKKAELLHRQNELILDSTGDGIYGLDEDGNTIFVNPAALRMIGCKANEIIGKNHHDIVHHSRPDGTHYPGEECPIHAAFKDGDIHHVAEGDVFWRKDGTSFPVEYTSTPMRDENNKLVGAVVSFRDISERLESRKKLEAALEKAQEGERVKSVFLANMSHEIRTPLNAILGFTSLLEESVGHLVGDDEKEFFQTIKSGGNRLMRTVHEILDISQIEAGTYPLKIEQMDLCKLVKELMSEHQLAAKEKNLNISYKSTLKSAYIQADKYGLSLAIGNLIDNAVKYTEKGEIIISVEQRSDQYILIIQDRGIGISENYIDSLFENFSQESEGFTKKFQGIGLGMAIAKRHLDMNKVDIQVESTKGVGTTFTLTFKSIAKIIVEKQIEQKEVIAATVTEPIKKPHVLVVEDDPNSQNLLKFFLDKSYNIRFAISVNEAQQQLKQNSVDLILLDLSLEEDEDGLELVRWMRTTKQWKKTPVIATTAHAFTKDRDNCLSAGCNDYLSKPIKREKLLEKIREFV